MSYPESMTTVTEIMADVLTLPRTDRGYIAQKIIESLDDETELPTEEKATLDRRSQELRDGTVKPISLEQLKQQVQSNLG